MAQLVDRKFLVTLGTKLLRTNYAGFEAEPSARLLWTLSEKHSFWVAFTYADVHAKWIAKAETICVRWK